MSGHSYNWFVTSIETTPRVGGSCPYRDRSLPDRSSPLPLWAQVSADIRRRVADGAFEEGFPGEIALTEQYEVSRHTVREALRVLRDEGLLRSERGRGTTIEEEFLLPEPRHPLLAVSHHRGSGDAPTQRGTSARHHGQPVGGQQSADRAQRRSRGSRTSPVRGR